MSSQISICDIQPGNSCTIKSYDMLGPAHIRLLELGLIPGEQIDIIRKAPFGDPIEIKVMNARLSLKKEEAKSILVHS